MVTSTPRRHVSLSKGDEPQLQKDLAILREQPHFGQDADASNSLQARVNAGQAIRQALIENSDARRTKDLFRLEDGFQVLLSAFETVIESHKGVSSTSDGEQLILDYVQTLFGVLSSALHEHRGNQSFFKDQTGGNGWHRLKESLLRLVFSEKSAQNAGIEKLVERLFGCLLGCTVNDDTVIPLFSKFRQRREYGHCRTDKGTESYKFTHTDLKSSIATGKFDEVVDPSFLEELKGAIGSSAFVYSPEPVVVLLQLWKSLQDHPPTRELSEAPASQGVLDTINHIGKLSTHNLAALHCSSLLSVALSYLTSSSLEDSHIVKLRSFVLSLLGFGVSTLDDAHFLYSKAASSPLIANVLLTALKMPRSPPFVHFDLSIHGFSSVELPGIGKAFPPTSSSAGYTLSLWFNVIQYDPTSHTTIFGAYESTQTCFVLVYLEKDSRNLILQTSVTSSRPSVRFKSVSFDKDRWYHVVVVHRRLRTTVSSRASLFIDGDFVEQVRSNYPVSPPVPTLHSEQTKPGHENHQIQAFLGTPQDLAPRLGKGLNLSQWRLASAHVFGEALTDDLIAVHHQLGPRYHGNYQDCLGSFQTYKASASLNIRNEMLHPGKEEKSDIVSAIRQKASALLAESQVILNISASVILDDDDQNDIDEKQLLKGLGKQASKNLRNVTRGGRNALAINGSIPSINEALQYPSGFAVLTGNPAVVVPQSLDDVAWRVGGCAAVGLALVDAAYTPKDLLVSLNILLECISDSWRNSEAMERENGFGVLATLLASKLELYRKNITDKSTSDKLQEAFEQHDLFTTEVLLILLRFLGYEPERPRESIINNALAYRVLLVDVDTWRNAGSSVQRLYFKQFSVFGIDSKYHYFNAKRLSKMRITKKWLEALKTDRFTSHTLDLFLEAFKVILTSSPSAESLRSLAMYITYARHAPRKRESSPLRPGKSTSTLRESTPRKQTLTIASPSPMTPRINDKADLDRSQVATRIMDFYNSLLCDEKDPGTIRKFARTVTNRWLLFLLADEEAKIVVLAFKILARLIVVNGTSYIQKFVGKTSGVIILQHRLRRWWKVPAMWLICFAILFGHDVARMNLERPFDLYSLLEIFSAKGEARVIYAEILPVITAMLQAGLRSITQDEDDPDSPLMERSDSASDNYNQHPQPAGRSSSVSLKRELLRLDTARGHDRQISNAVAILHTVARFFSEIQSKSQSFRDFTVVSSYVQELLAALFPIVVSSDAVSPGAELHARDSRLLSRNNEVLIRPFSKAQSGNTTLIRTALPEHADSPTTKRIQAPRRMSSYVFVIPTGSQQSPSLSKLKTNTHEGNEGNARTVTPNAKNSTVEEILELLIAVFSDQIFYRKDFPGLGLFMKVPPGFEEHQAYFETFILQNALSSLGNTIKLSQQLLWEPRILTNIARFATHIGEAVYEGWFIDGFDATLEFLGSLLEYLQLPVVAKIKSIRLCSQVIATMRSVLLRVVLLRLSELDETTQSSEVVSFLEKLVYWQTVLLVTQDGQDYYVRLLMYLLYHKIVSPNGAVRMAAANLWRMLLVQRHHYGSDLLHEALGHKNDSLSRGFDKIMEVDNDTFVTWIDDHREGLDSIFSSTFGKLWEAFVALENTNTRENAEARIGKRKERLKVWQADRAAAEEALRRHEISADHWGSNIYTSEHLRRQRALQDAQDSVNFNVSTWNKMGQELRRPCGILEDTTDLRWQLDQTEGRNRMRKRLIPNRDAHQISITPKRKQSQGPARQRGSSIGIRRKASMKNATSDPRHLQIPTNDASKSQNGSDVGAVTPPEPVNEILEAEEGFEIVEDPQEDYENYEDKNRKVMRSLERGDQVEHVLNVSRIVGLEACEGLLILGKIHLYLLDNLFQRADGEIVNVWQAPQSERDPYVQMISGREAGERGPSAINAAHEVRNWRWEDVLSISKRRFLFRDVAVEIFFVDGRSYLLTSATVTSRNELYQRLQGKASNITDRALSSDYADTWRIESVRNAEDEAQTLGSKFTSVFAQSHSSPATRRWVKGEISNFHYLMLINTMAGRTFNDLTQYPVFPWVLADYSSEELDLSNPNSFRDLTKPMGCQNPERQADFRERYHTFAEMNEGSPSFHYGTHYSSAMIVTSYLIRLQPFVQSYLLLQGGSFDHPDRLFYSIEKAWNSASRENMTDVRELIPEFYYLPEFLLNSNNYDFGMRQGNGGAVDTVVLPPWAKGDPKIFIAKHREALESEHVSKHLHQWIDLIFGHKQRGDAALEATNVFHHLSYHGAKDLETISDPLERLATIGIIHNFGQTPFQVFQKPHPAREDSKNRVRRLDTAIENLTRLPFPVLESHERVSSLQYSWKHDRILCSSFFRLSLAPAFDKYMEWGFVDGSVRFYMAESKKLIGLFEHVHQGQLSHAMFADSKTLITAGMDCTVSVWALILASKSVDLQPKACLFGHRAPITTLAVSRSFSALLSASSDGQVLLWDLNRLRLVRVLAKGDAAQCAAINDVSGIIMLCRARNVSLFTLNGEDILDQDVCHDQDDGITACAFYEGSGNEYLERNLVFTGHKRGVVNVWNHTIKGDKFVLVHLKRMDHLDQVGFNMHVAMTAILPMAQAVYTADEDGDVYEWDCIRRQ